jgi:DNA helicase-2/ATP-dependent DNA helicase PcrA
MGGVTTVRAEMLLEGLDESQRAAVTSSAMPLCILAGAGSGKTRVLTRRIAYRVAVGAAEGRHVLALTFSRRAAGELAHRLGALGVPGRVTAGTFHAVAYAVLRRYWADQGLEAPALLERKARLLAPLLGPATRGGRGAPVTPADVAGEIEWAKARMVRAADYVDAAAAAGRVPPLPPAAIASLYRRYEETKRERRFVDFDDLLALCARALERDERFAAAQRDRFRHLFVDEFQDVNALQHRLLEAWRGERADLCVVGDPDQAIYAWNGADAGHLREFARAHPGATVVRLGHNYRSTPEILDAGAAVLAELPDPSPRPVAHRASGPRPTVRAYDDDTAEARGIARRLAGWQRDGRRWSQLAVLTRTNAQLAVLEEALRAAGVPYRVRGGAALLDQPEVRAALGRADRPSGSRPMAAWRAELAESLAAEAPAADGPVARRRENLEQLLRLAAEYVRAEPDGTVATFSAWLSSSLQREDAASEREADVVDLVTFHAAKGLEWPVVVLAGMEKGLVPHSGATTAEARAEETRLVYVALTRAADEVHLTWAAQRTMGERTVRRTVSPFVEVVDSAGRPRPVVSSRTGDSARRVARPARAAAGGSGPADAGLVVALKHWRRAAAQAAGVPAYVVFSDATLEAIAAARPSDEVGLRAVPGIGPAKAERYGAAVLRLVAEAAATPG